MKANILIVDDEKGILSSLSRHLKLEGYSVITAEDGATALSKFYDETIDLVLLDVILPDINGMDVLEKLKKGDPNLPVIIISGHGTIEMAVKATRLGAFDFIEKPINPDKLDIVIENALKYSFLKRENISFKEEYEKKYKIIGNSKAIKEVISIVQKIAPTKSWAFITGESGTGKELVARAIHNQSPRKNNPFVMVNCAAIPNELIESELFGHEKGSFTGAIYQKKGKFELANLGTIFLDEIGDMHPEMQAKLLRVLEDGKFQRVGGANTIKVDVRVIAATNKNIEQEIASGRFRRDLYYRLNVIPIYVPPLRERVEDIPLLIDHFLATFCAENGKPMMRFSDEAMLLLKRYNWPGNVRELKNLIERLVILVSSSVITTADIQTYFPNQIYPIPLNQSPKSLRDRLLEAEKEIILQQLNANDWHITKTAEDLQIERSHLYKKMRKLGISK